LRSHCLLPFCTMSYEVQEDAQSTSAIRLGGPHRDGVVIQRQELVPPVSIHHWSSAWNYRPVSRSRVLYGAGPV
jgi:hypothetical protein